MICASEHCLSRITRIKIANGPNSKDKRNQFNPDLLNKEAERVKEEL